MLGYSDDGVTDYSANPVYFNFEDVENEDRNTIFGRRGEVKDGSQGFVSVLAGISPNWTEKPVIIADPRGDDTTIFDNIDLRFYENGSPVKNTDGSFFYEEAKSNILGFTQHADDDLSVTEFIHTYQIPERR